MRPLKVDIDVNDIITFVQTVIVLFTRYVIDETDGYLSVYGDATTGWVHGVMVYHGMGQGITVYENGRKIGSDTDKYFSEAVTGKPRGNGQVFIGIRNHGNGDRYASVSVDEIKFYNRQLSEEEISNMYRQK